MVISTFKSPSKRKRQYKNIDKQSFILYFITTFIVSVGMCIFLKSGLDRLCNTGVVIEPIKVYKIIDSKKDISVVYNEKSYSSFVAVDSVMYTNTSVNLREGAGVDSKIIKTLNFSDSVYIEGYMTGSEWYKVSYKGYSGYIHSDYLVDEVPVIKVEATAYYDRYNRASASGRELIEGKSLAGKIAWLGKRVELYRCNSDGSVGEYLGIYQFDDTGYGQESGVGNSVILEGRSIGTIENGTCIDIYMNDYTDCITYGRKDLYIRFID